VLGLTSYIILVLVLVEIVLIVFLAREKITKAAFWSASVPMLFIIALFLMGDRIMKITIPQVGTIEAAATLATQNVDDIRNIRADIDHQKQAIDAVATAAHDAENVIKAQLQQLKGELAQAKRLTDQLQEELEYSGVARYNVVGLLGLVTPPLVEAPSPLNRILSPYVHLDPGNSCFFTSALSRAPS
jgi:hypothetical protein